MVLVINDPITRCGLGACAFLSALLYGHQQVRNSFAIMGVLSDCTGGGCTAALGVEPPEFHQKDGQEDAQQGFNATNQPFPELPLPPVLHFARK